MSNPRVFSAQKDRLKLNRLITEYRLCSKHNFFLCFAQGEKSSDSNGRMCRADVLNTELPIAMWLKRPYCSGPLRVRLGCSAVKLLTLYFTQLSPLPTPTPILDQVGCLRNPIRVFSCLQRPVQNGLRVVLVILDVVPMEVSPRSVHHAKMLTNPVIMVQQSRSENLPPLLAWQRFTDPSHCDMVQRTSIGRCLRCC